MPDKPIEIAPFVKLLDEHVLRYVFIGGIAMALHGSAHIIEDVAQMAEALKPLHPKLRGVPGDVPFSLDERTLRNTANLTLQTDWGALDILADVAGVTSFEDLGADALVVDVEGVPVRIASLDKVIAMKRAANRVKDHNHLLELEPLRDIASGS